jgi:hypothetical protein
LLLLTGDSDQGEVTASYVMELAHGNCRPTLVWV